MGRDAAYGTLEALLAGALDGERRIALVRGEPGIGKTRLCQELAAAARARGANVLYGRSEEDLGLPFQPIAEALGHLVAHAPQALLDDHAGATSGALARLVPELARRTGGPPSAAGDPEAERNALYHAVVALLSAATVQAPLVLVLDDLHWADRPTLLLIRHLLSAPTAGGLLTVLSHRSTDVGPDHPLQELRAGLHREDGFTAVDLAGLAPTDVAGLLGTGDTAADDDADALAAALHRETGGNPFFVREVLRHLLETGQVLQRNGAWIVPADLSELDLPTSVREVVHRRVTRLGPAVTEVLTAASVIGRDVDLDLLERTADVDEDALLDALDAAVGARLLAETGDGRYTFAHALVQDTLYGTLGSARRRRRHRRVAEALETVCAGRPGARAGELAHHWLEAGDAHAEQALVRVADAGRRAYLQLAPQEAARWYRRGLDLADRVPGVDPGTRLDLLIDRGIAERDGGDPGHRETLLEAAATAEQAGDAGRLVRAALANSRGFVSSSGELDAARVATLEAALRAVGPEDGDERASLLATTAAELAFSPPDLQRRMALCAEALGIARRLDRPRTLARVATTCFVPMWVPATVEERLLATEEAVDAAERTGDRDLLCQSVHWRGVARFDAGRWDDARADVERESALADELHQPTRRWQATYDRAFVAQVAGRLDEADALATEALQLGTGSGQPDAVPYYAAQVLNVRFDQGRLAELHPLAVQTVELNPGIPGFRGALALAAAAAGLDDDARALLRAEADDDFRALPTDLVWLPGLSLFAITCARLDDERAAAVLRRALGPWREHLAFSGLTFWGLVAHHLGNLDRVLGQTHAALDTLLALPERYERLGAPIWAARARVDAARALHARGGPGDAGNARELLQRAGVDAAAAGAAGLAARARTLLDERTTVS